MRRFSSTLLCGLALSFFFSFAALAHQPKPSARMTIGKGTFAEPSNRMTYPITVNREVQIPIYILAQIERNGELLECQLKSATVSFLGAQGDIALLQVKVSGGVSSKNKNDACENDAKVALPLDKFSDIVRAADSEIKDKSEQEEKKRTLLDLLKKR